MLDGGLYCVPRFGRVGLYAIVSGKAGFDVRPPRSSFPPVRPEAQLSPTHAMAVKSVTAELGAAALGAIVASGEIGAAEMTALTTAYGISLVGMACVRWQPCCFLCVINAALE